MPTPPLRIYNTLSRTKEAFEPLDPARVRLYVCGPTVYDFAHIGNARPLIVFDVLYRLLRRIYGDDKVRYVRNITDVDDKINARAAARGITIRELTEETNRVFQEDVRALGCLDPDVQPRATEHIEQMKQIIEKLIASGHAYAADGHVLFNVPSMPSYGRLSRRSLDEMLAGARVEVAPYKRGDMDFVLWKPSKENEPGWDSPWGWGRPGWHIECSAMSWEYLGETFDIHGGGIDLVFPHHENEIAQSCCAFNREVMATYWMHNGFLQVEGEKMSKSLGNFVTIHELLRTRTFNGRSWPGQVLRFAMLQTHYTQPIDWTAKRLQESAVELGEWALDLDAWYQELTNSAVLVPTRKMEPSSDLMEALSDDLNTPAAIAVLRKHYARAKEGSSEAQLLLLADCEFLAILSRRSFFTLVQQQDWEGPGFPTPDDLLLVQEMKTAKANANEQGVLDAQSSLRESGWNAVISEDGLVNLRRSSSSEVTERDTKIKALIDARRDARAAKDWAESDRLRDEIAAMGIALKDNKDGTTTWEIKR